MFAYRYANSVNSSDLRDDDRHHATDALAASALADVAKTGLGALLCRVKFTDGTAHAQFESGTRNLPALLKIWKEKVRAKGISRAWVRSNTAWDIEAASRLYERVAEASLAFWIDSRCGTCAGARVDHNRRTCECCKGTGQAEIVSGRFEREIILDLVSELEDLTQTHVRNAASHLRKKE